MSKIKGLSLFSNIGVAEAYLKEIGIDIALANEIDEKRAKFYSHIYPNTKMIIGDITNEDIFSRIINESLETKIDFVIATPPCQGMSTAGKMDNKDPRNQLITYAIDAIRKIKPKYVLLENVPQQLKTKIIYNNKKILIPEYITKMLEEDYIINNNIINSCDYGVPQTRFRSIYLMVRKDLNFIWSFPDKDSNVITLREAIGNLPSIDPIIQGYSKDKLLSYFPDFEKNRENGEKVSKWHKPPKHKIRHVEIMKYTPEGKSAFENEHYYPKKDDGQRIKGYSNTYKRQSWDRPAYTVTTYNGAVCSHDNVHPGRPIGCDKNGDMMYSDARVLTIYELLIVMSLPKDWDIPDWADESLIRHSIGEGIPPLVVKKILLKLINKLNDKSRRNK